MERGEESREPVKGESKEKGLGTSAAALMVRNNVNSCNDWWIKLNSTQPAERRVVCDPPCHCLLSGYPSWKVLY